jgi:hypothetical protein
MGVKAVFIDILYFSRLSLQSFGLIVKFIYKKRRARSIFKKTLILDGISQEVAKELAKSYPDPMKEILKLANTRKTGR